MVLRVLGRLYGSTGGLTFCARDVFLFCHTFSEVPRPIALKLCHMIGTWLNFIMQVQKFGGSPPQKKKLGAKNMQNFGRFYTTSHFDREYLQKEATHRKDVRPRAIPPAFYEESAVNFGLLTTRNYM